MVGHGNLLHNLACTHADAGYTRDSVSLSWLPVNHDMGLINGVLQAAFSGSTAYLMAPAAFLQRPVMEYQYWVDVWTFHEKIADALAQNDLEQGRQLLEQHFELLPKDPVNSGQ
jgi:acyl-CoA synthetase (AMP-forming)/AMP-acid ligase II